MELQNEIVIQNTPAKIEVNFEAVRARMEKEMERYQYVVTAETVADAKKMATELNKLKKTISDLRKSEIRKASVDIDKFDQGMKDLEITAEKYRKQLLDQAQRFDDETRETCRNLLQKARDWLFDKYEVEPKFQRAVIDDLVKISAVTEKGNLTKAVKQDLEARVRDDKALQDRTARRALELENQCYKAGLKAPLTLEHVKAFLYDSDHDYQHHLDSLIASEVNRQEEAEKRIRQDLEREQARQREEEEARSARKAVEQQAEQPSSAGSRQEPRKADLSPGCDDSTPPLPRATARPAPAKGLARYTVTCTFEIEVPATLREDQIDAELRKVLAKAGVAKTLRGVYVKRHAEEAA